MCLLTSSFGLGVKNVVISVIIPEYKMTAKIFLSSQLASCRSR